MESQYLSLVEGLCSDSGVDSVIIRAIISVESGWIHGRTRYESGWKYFYRPHIYSNKLGITLSTESVGQMHSYSLMQVMGAVMREKGYSGYWLDITPEIGVKIGISHFKGFLEKYQGLDKAISAYNSGQLFYKDGKFKNQVYVDKVLNLIKEIRDGSEKTMAK